jgi:hypothetical protein
MKVMCMKLATNAGGDAQRPFRRVISAGPKVNGGVSVDRYSHLSTAFVLSFPNHQLSAASRLGPVNLAQCVASPKLTDVYHLALLASSQGLATFN